MISFPKEQEIPRKENPSPATISTATKTEIAETKPTRLFYKGGPFFVFELIRRSGHRFAAPAGGRKERRSAGAESEPDRSTLLFYSKTLPDERESAAPAAAASLGPIWA